MSSRVRELARAELRDAKVATPTVAESLQPLAARSQMQYKRSSKATGVQGELAESRMTMRSGQI